MIADDGTVLGVNDHVYMVCEPPGEPYYLGRIMSSSILKVIPLCRLMPCVSIGSIGPRILAARCRTRGMSLLPCIRTSVL